MKSGGTIFKGSRPLRGGERRFLLLRWAACRGGQALVVAALGALLWWSFESDDTGLRFIFAVLLIPATVACWHLHRLGRPFERDLFENRVESVIGAIGNLDLTAQLVPLHMGGHVFYVQAELLRRKREGEPIMIEVLQHTHLAATIDGRSNLMSLKRWLELGGPEISRAT